MVTRLAESNAASAAAVREWGHVIRLSKRDDEREQREERPLAVGPFSPLSLSWDQNSRAHSTHSLMHLHAATGDIPTTTNETRSEKREKTSLLAFSLNRLNAARSLVRSFAAVRCVAVEGGLGIIFFDRLLHTLKEGEREKY